MSSRSISVPSFLVHDTGYFYLDIGPQGCALYAENMPNPLYQLREPLLLAQGIAMNSQTVHLVILKGNGDLSYSIISRSGSQQTTILTKLDVRATKYSRLILLPLGDMVHIFYAYAHQAIPDLWYIEHRFWNGKAWQNIRLGEVVHSRSPMYQVALDSQRNIHYLATTFQGRQSLLLQNRFHGTFNIWGNPTQSLSMQREVVDMSSILTSDNTHHLFWVTKTPPGQFELYWARRPQAQELSSSWQTAPTLIKAFNGPWKGLGSVEMNGAYWLMINAEQENLMTYRGENWHLLSSQPLPNRPMMLIKKGDKTFYATYWLLDRSQTHTPVFAKELGLVISPPTPNFTPNPTHISANITPPFNNPMVTPISIPLNTTNGERINPQDTPFFATPAPNPIQPSIQPSIQPPVQTAPSPPKPEIKTESEKLATSSDVSVPQLTEEPKTITSQMNSDLDVEEKANPVKVLESIKPIFAELMEPLIKTVASLEEEKQTFTASMKTLISKFSSAESSLSKLEQEIAELKLEQENMKANSESESKPVEQKPEEQKPVEHRPEEQKPEEQMEYQISKMQMEQENKQEKGFWHRWFA